MANDTEIVSPLRHIAEGLATSLFAAGALALLVGVVRADPLPAPKPAAQQPGPAIEALAPQDWRVVDGDTIKIAGERIRLPDIDAPEIFHPRCPEERALGLAAKDALAGLLTSNPWHLAPTGKRDRYGRPLDLVVIDLADGDRSAGAILIERRLAVFWAGRRPNWCILIREGW